MKIAYINNESNHDYHGGNQLGHNHLGLRAQPQQQPRGFWQNVKAYFGWGPQHYAWISAPSSQRIALLRAAYVEMSQDLSQGHAKKGAIEAVLSQFNQGTFDYWIAEDRLTEYPPLAKLTAQLREQDQSEYQLLRQTVLCDPKHGMPAGMLMNAPGCDAQLAQIITMFTYLYGEAPQDSPLWVASEEALLVDVDCDQPNWQRLAVLRYLDRVAQAITNVSTMSRRELNMSFEIDDVKHKAIVRLLKIAFNQLSYKWDYGYRFKNLAPVGEDKPIEMTEHPVNTMQAHEQLQNKQTLRTNKIRVFWFACLSAIILAAGQVAITVGSAVGGLAIAIGLSAGLANTILFALNIKEVILAFLKGELTDASMPRFFQFLLGLFGVCSLATGIVSGAFAFDSLIALSGMTIATAPGVFVMSAGVVGLVTVIGLTSLFFKVGVDLVNTLRKYDSFSAFFSSIKQGFLNFFHWPKVNQSILDLHHEVNEIKQQLGMATKGHRGWSVKTEEGQRLQALLQQKQHDLNMKRREHTVRMYLTNVFKLVLSVFAVMAAYVATRAFMNSSSSGTKEALMATGRVSEFMANQINSVLQVMATVVNGSLNLRYLVAVAPVFAGMMAKFVTQVGFGVVNFAGMLVTGRLFAALAEGVRVYQANPYKSLVPLGRLMIGLSILSVVFLNAFGFGLSLSEKGAITLPSWCFPGAAKPLTFTMVMSTSFALNSSASLDVVGATQAVGTPMLNLSYQKVADALGSEGPANQPTDLDELEFEIDPLLDQASVRVDSNLLAVENELSRPQSLVVGST